MPGPSIIAQLQRRVGRFPIELPAAAALAVAVAFLTVALPDWRFERAVTATGLGNVLSAAQPPLGTTARIVAALALAALSFLAAWFALRALDGKPEVSDFPTFRAADLHPDAPRRRPILAGAEFGAPAEEAPAPARRRALVSEPLPSFLAPQPSQIADLVPEPEPMPEPTSELMPEPESTPAPELFPAKKKREDAAAADWLAESRNELRPPLKSDFESTDSAEAGPEGNVPSFLQARADISSRRGDDQTVESEVNRDTPDDIFEERIERTPSEGDMSVANLMARLESGVARHGGRPPAGAASPAQEELRRALGDLDRISDRRS